MKTNYIILDTIDIILEVFIIILLNNYNITIITITITIFLIYNDIIYHINI